jgi:hypothetical protein
MLLPPFPDAHTWALENFAAVDLGDARRNRRLIATAEQIAQQPNGSLPSKFSWNPLRAVYRLCHRPEATHPVVVAQHLQATRSAMAQVPLVLILHDTTALDFTRHPALQGTGPIGDGIGRGFLQHNSLAIEPQTRRILGLADQQLTTRTPAPKGETRTARQRRPRESQLWEQGFRRIGPAPPTACWIDVADRGSDLFEAMHAARQLGHHFLFRACQDRAVQVGRGATTRRAYLKTFARSLPARVHDTVEIPGKGSRPARTAAVALAAAAVEVQVPKLLDRRGASWEPIPAWVVRIWEPEPPAGAEPLEWVLVSSLPVKTPEQMRRSRDWYACRPLVEQFHQVEKTGCGEEQLRLRTAAALAPLLGVLSVVAVRILQLRWWSTVGAAAAAEEAATPAELVVLRRLPERMGPIETARDFVRGVARLGGFLGRRHDGEPGWQTLWRGYQRLQDMVLGLSLQEGETAATDGDAPQDVNDIPP